MGGFCKFGSFQPYQAHTQLSHRPMVQVGNAKHNGNSFIKKIGLKLFFTTTNILRCSQVVREGFPGTRSSQSEGPVAYGAELGLGGGEGKRLSVS